MTASAAPRFLVYFSEKMRLNSFGIPSTSYFAYTEWSALCISRPALIVLIAKSALPWLSLPSNNHETASNSVVFPQPFGPAKTLRPALKSKLPDMSRKFSRTSCCNFISIDFLFLSVRQVPDKPAAFKELTCCKKRCDLSGVTIIILLPGNTVSICLYLAAILTASIVRSAILTRNASVFRPRDLGAAFLTRSRNRQAFARLNLPHSGALQFGY